ETGACLGFLKDQHHFRRRGLLGIALADGRRLSWYSEESQTSTLDKTLRLYDYQSGTCLETFEGHSNLVLGALELPGGRLLSWSADKTLRLWSESGAQCLAELKGHTSAVHGAISLSGGQLLSWAGTIFDARFFHVLSADYVLRLWDGNTGKALAVLD